MQCVILHVWLIVQPTGCHFPRRCCCRKPALQVMHCVTSKHGLMLGHLPLCIYCRSAAVGGEPGQPNSVCYAIGASLPCNCCQMCEVPLAQQPGTIIICKPIWGGRVQG